MPFFLFYKKDTHSWSNISRKGPIYAPKPKGGHVIPFESAHIYIYTYAKDNFDGPDQWSVRATCVAGACDNVLMVWTRLTCTRWADA